MTSLLDQDAMPAMWDRVLKLPINFFKNYQVGDMVDRVLNIVSIRHYVTNILYHYFSFIPAILFLGLMFYYDKLLSIIVIFCIFLYILCMRIFYFYIIENQKNIEKLNGHVYGNVFQYITGLSKIKISSSAARLYRNWAQLNAKKESLSFKNQKIQSYIYSIDQVYATLITLFIFIYEVYKRKTGGQFNTGSFFAFYLASLNFTYTVLDAIHNIFENKKCIKPLYQRLQPIFESQLEIKNKMQHPGKLTGLIEVNQVAFHYENSHNDFLKEINLLIKPGQFVGIVGDSGAGKSTLFRLLLGFESPTSGAIYYDKNELSKVDIKALRRQIGVVLQNAQLFADSIYKNIVCSMPYSLEEAWEVARLCGIDKDIEQMPMGMHTIVTEGATNISVAQRQLILIARVLINKPKILFFDEATSVLDNRTQALVTERIDKLDVTRIVIAHRLNTVQKADCIHVMSKGRIVEFGTYEELKNKGGFFSRLLQEQNG